VFDFCTDDQKAKLAPMRARFKAYEDALAEKKVSPYQSHENSFSDFYCLGN